jgi:hypothetical protein
MPEREIDKREPPVERRDVLLWLSILAGPLAWALHQQVSYMLTPTACVEGRKWMLHLAFVACLLLAAGGALLAWRIWKDLPGGSTEKGEEKASRSRFLALSGAVMSASFILVIVAAEVPNLVLGVCD